MPWDLTPLASPVRLRSRGPPFPPTHLLPHRARAMRSTLNCIAQALPVRRCLSTQSELSAHSRGKPGGRRTTRLRAAGWVPAMLFSQRKHRDKRPIAVPSSSLAQAITSLGGPTHFCATPLSLAVDTFEPMRVMPQQLHFDAVTERPNNATFMRAPPGTLVNAVVPISLLNEDASPGVRKGGFVHLLRRSLTLRGEVENIPHSLTLDATLLDVKRPGFLSDLQIPEDVRVLRAPHEQPVARIAGRTRGRGRR